MSRKASKIAVPVSIRSLRLFERNKNGAKSTIGKVACADAVILELVRSWGSFLADKTVMVGGNKYCGGVLRYLS